MAVRILMVEDEEEDERDLREKAGGLGYVVEASTDDGNEACRLAGEQAPDVVLMDVRLRGPMHGLEAARLIQERYHIPVVVVTGRIDDERIRGAKEARVSAVLRKPVGRDDLKAAIEVAIHQAGERARAARDRDEQDRRRESLREWSLAALKRGPAACDLEGIYTDILEHVAEGLRPMAATLYRLAEPALVRVARLTRGAGGEMEVTLGEGAEAPGGGAEQISLRAAREGSPVNSGEGVAVPLMRGDEAVAVLHVQAAAGQRRIERWRRDAADYAELGGRLLCECQLDDDIDDHLEELRNLADLGPATGAAETESHAEPHETDSRDAPAP